MSFNKIMTTRELANYIKLNEKTVIKMAQAGELPGVKIGSQWRFHLESIDAYVQNDIMKSSDSELDKIIETGINIVPLSRLTGENLIQLNIRAQNKKDVLVELSDLAVEQELTSSREKLLNELIKRETMLSTAVGNGVAIPHPRHPSPSLFRKPNIIVACSKKGVDFGAPDSRSVHVFFMTCAPTEFVHLRLLAKISKLLHISDITKKFIEAENEKKIMQILLEYERANFSLNKGP